MIDLDDRDDVGELLRRLDDVAAVDEVLGGLDVDAPWIERFLDEMNAEFLDFLDGT